MSLELNDTAYRLCIFCRDSNGDTIGALQTFLSSAEIAIGNLTLDTITIYWPEPTARIDIPSTIYTDTTLVLDASRSDAGAFKKIIAYDWIVGDMSIHTDSVQYVTTPPEIQDSLKIILTITNDANLKAYDTVYVDVRRHPKSIGNGTILSVDTKNCQLYYEFGGLFVYEWSLNDSERWINLAPFSVKTLGKYSVEPIVWVTSEEKDMFDHVTVRLMRYNNGYFDTVVVLPVQDTRIVEIATFPGGMYAQLFYNYSDHIVRIYEGKVEDILVADHKEYHYHAVNGGADYITNIQFTADTIGNLYLLHEQVGISGMLLLDKYSQGVWTNIGRIYGNCKCWPIMVNGKYFVAAFDLDKNVIRLYDGMDLTYLETTALPISDTNITAVQIDPKYEELYIAVNGEILKYDAQAWRTVMNPIVFDEFKSPWLDISRIVFDGNLTMYIEGKKSMWETSNGRIYVVQ